MADWHAMMVSLMWNVQAWRDWIQENITRALAHQHNFHNSGGELLYNQLIFMFRLHASGLLRKTT